MKKNLLLFLIIISTFSSLAQIPTNGLVAFYPFNGDAQDASGNNNHGTQQGGVNFITSTDRFGVAGKAAGFDGVNDYIELAGSNFQLQKITLSSWIKTSSANFCLMGRSNEQNSSNEQFSFQSNTQSPWSGMHLAVKRTSCTAGVGWQFVNMPNVINDNAWHHVVASFDGKNINSYLDGILIKSTILSDYIDLIQCGNEAIRIAKWWNSDPRFLNGSLDDIRIYNRALTDSEVQALYQAEAPPIDITTGLVAHYKFENNFLDQTSNNHHGTQNGGVIFENGRNGAGKAAKFDGSSKYVIANSSEALTTMTQTFWIKPTSLDIQTPLQIGYDDCIGNNPILNGVSFYGLSNITKIIVSDLQAITTGYLLPSADVWYFISIQQKDGNYKLFVNDKLEFTGTGPIPRSANQIRIGSGTGCRYFNGLIDDIRIYNRALTDSEVQAIYQAEAPPIDITTGLIAQYKMDGDARDASGNGNHGTTQGGVAFGTDRFGNAGKAASFDGVTGWVSTNLVQSTITQYTISTWVKTSRLSGDMALVNARGPEATGGCCSTSRSISTGTGSGKFSFGLNSDFISVGKTTESSLIANEWTQIVGVLSTNDGQNASPSQFKVYINGALASSTENNYNPINQNILAPFTGNGGIKIGSWEGQYFFQGLLDDIRIYNRALTDADVAYLYELENNRSLSHVTIEALAEPINQNSYRVPKEATVHHYFLAKDIAGNPLKDVTVVYQYGPFLHQSIPTDASGLIDLNIMVGGRDPAKSDDDWSPIGTQTVTFNSLLVGNVTGVNAFTSFNIDVIDKAERIDEEMGIGVGFKVGNDAYEESGNNKINVGSYKIKLKGTAGLQLGATTDGYIKIKPVSSNNWNVYFNAGIGSSIGAGVDLGLNFGDKNFGIGGNVKSNAELNDAVRLEAGYNFNLNNKQEIFKLAELIFTLNSSNTNNKTLATIFKNLANNAQPAISNLNYSASFAYGAGFGFDATAFAKMKVRKLNMPGYGQIPEPEIDVNIQANGRFTDNIIFEAEKNVGTHMVNSLDVGFEAQSSIIGMVNITKGNRKNNPSAKSQPFKFFDYSTQHNIEVKRSLDLNQLPTRSSYSFSSLSSELELDPSSTNKYNIMYRNKFSYGSQSISKLYNVVHDSNNPNFLQLNSIAEFLTEKSSSLIGSAWINQGLAGSLYTQADKLNLWMQSISRENNFPLNEIDYTTEQEITLVSKDSKGFSIPGAKNLSFAVELNSWRTYKHNSTKAVYSKSLDRVLLTLDYPEITSNLELPQTDPLEDFKTYIDNALAITETQIIDRALLFITKVSEIVTQSVDMVFTNWNLPRRNSFGATMYEPTKSTSITNLAPSVFTFTVPKTVFNINTNIDFNYYYPNNEVVAITPSDTFRIISDLFTLGARVNTTALRMTHNGNFSIETTFSISDLALASLPSNLVPVVLFQPQGSNQWIQIGNANTTISFDQLGTFGLGVRISNDNVSPTILVTSPVSYNPPNYFEVTLSDDKSGIDWAKTLCYANNSKVNISRINGSNTFRVPISAIPSLSSGLYYFSINTSDLAGNAKDYTNIYPCDEYKIIKTLELEPNNPILLNALRFIEANGNTPINKSVFLKAGDNIELKPGFETSGTLFNAEIGGCSN